MINKVINSNDSAPKFSLMICHSYGKADQHNSSFILKHECA